ncbi:MAG: DUF5615 family PIN-like protein [Balneolaceae bacterium]|nr:DUF5615 family PIN-like protein [Balneolaceae bacterium]
MTFFLDINIPLSFANFLEGEGHKTIIGAKSGFHGSTDWEICEHAIKNKSVIVTHDLDFGELLAVSGSSKPSVIIFRIQPLTVENIKESFSQIIKETKNELNEGAIVVIEKSSYRLRKLPIRK